MESNKFMCVDYLEIGGAGQNYMKYIMLFLFDELDYVKC